MTAYGKEISAVARFRGNEIILTDEVKLRTSFFGEDVKSLSDGTSSRIERAAIKATVFIFIGYIRVKFQCQETGPPDRSHSRGPRGALPVAVIGGPTIAIPGVFVGWTGSVFRR